MSEATDYPVKIEILAELWTDYREEEAFTELFGYADLGFPIAYALDHGIVETTDAAEGYIDETFALLLETLGVEDAGFESLVDLFEAAGKPVEPH